MGAFEELSWRGLVAQTTAENMAEVLGKPLAVYSGFDPTAASLHAGNLVPLMLLTHLRRHGHQALPLVGGATGMIGDPSGKTSERTLLDSEKVLENTAKIRAQIERFFANDEGPPAQVVDNLDWLGQVRLLDFLRDVGKHFAVNQMIQRDSVKARFESRESGISYTEFSYMLLQAYDFHELNRRHGCRLQVGASDQWGNIVSGVDLCRRLSGETVYGLTAPLLTNSEGKKYGKSEKGAVFLDGSRTSPFDFYQFWFNSADADVGRFLRWLTVRGKGGDRALEAAPGAERRPSGRWPRISPAASTAPRRARRGAARVWSRCSAAAICARSSGATLDAALSARAGDHRRPRALRREGALLVDLLAEVGACPSKSDARRQMAAGGDRGQRGSPGRTSAETRVTAR